MTNHQRGYVIFIAALGMMASLLAPEVAGLPSWSAALSPAFCGKALAHFAVVSAAFAGGRIIPTKEKS